MPEHDDGQAGYADAVDHYWQAGWRGILPLRRAHKKTPPAGFTGRAGQTPSYADVLAWADLYPDGNLCLRLPDGVIGIDVDAYGAKTGAAALTEAEKRWGHLPDTVRTTSRSDGISGIRLYRIPAGVQLNEGIDFPDLGVGDIEIVQRHHRYALAWPSTHPEGGQYRWLNHAGQPATIPNIDDLPELPTAWIKALTHTPETILNPDAVYSTPEALTNGTPSSKVAQRLRQAIKELNLPGQSRHDTARKHVLALLRLGKLGETGVDQALRALGEMFTALVASDRPGGREEATREYRSMVTGIGAARALAQPSNTEWAHTIAATAINNAPEPEPTPTSEPESGTYAAIFDAENGFWETTQTLTDIYTAAMTRGASPWAVLAFCAARALTRVRPNNTLPALIGGPGTLNWFAALASPSGGGKGAAASIARELLPADGIRERNLGSGEGMLAAYYKPGTKDTPPETHEANMFIADEVDNVAALGSRTGSTLMSTLRSAFSGETLGFTYKSGDHHISGDEYRMTMIIAVQPQRAAALLNDGGGGTPQRLMWFPATDTRIPLTRSPNFWIPTLTLPPMDGYPRALTIPDEAADQIWEHHVKRSRGEGDALDGHAMFSREKFAYGLTLLHGRIDMSSQDWELSGIAAEVSSRTRDWVTAEMRIGEQSQAADKGRLMGVAAAEADDEKAFRTSQKAQRVARWVLDKLRESEAGMTNRELSRACSSRDRNWLQGALEGLSGSGLIKRDEADRWVQL